MANGENYMRALANAKKNYVHELANVGKDVLGANYRQIGGQHYKTGDYQHWDFVREVLSNDYLLGCATKYVSRWRKKNGVEDLRKALHYIQKAEESGVMAFGMLPGDFRGELHFGPGSYVQRAVYRLTTASGCDLKEAQAIWEIACAQWEEASRLINEIIAEEEISKIIAEEEAKPQAATAEDEASRSPTRSPQ